MHLLIQHILHTSPSPITTHCKEDSNYVFPEIKLRGLVPNFNIHTSVSDLYIPRTGPPILLQPNRQTDFWEYINHSQIYQCRNWD
jgi:hypothetical protein